jgi:hypothetical protein
MGFLFLALATLCIALGLMLILKDFDDEKEE